jgi:hypothetical protein
MLLGLVVACGPDSTAKHFCQNTRIVFNEMAVSQLDDALLALESPDVYPNPCKDVTTAGAVIRTMVITFKAAAIPFRDRAEVARTLDELENLTLDELNKIRCYRPPTAEQLATLLPRLDQTRAKLASITAACSVR